MGNFVWNDRPLVVTHVSSGAQTVLSVKGNGVPKLPKSVMFSPGIQTINVTYNGYIYLQDRPLDSNSYLNSPLRRFGPSDQMPKRPSTLDNHP
jgi:hypothetical protein